MTDKIKEVIKDISRKFNIPLSPEEVNLIAEKSQIKKYKHNSTILAEGEICSEYYYIEKGLLRMYYVSDGKEEIVSLANEGQVMCSMRSFYKHTPSRLIIETIEPSVLYCISSDALDEFRTTNLNIHRFCFEFIQRFILSVEDNHFITRTPKATDRYQKLMETFPEIVRRTPVKYLASLLQIRPETLSRIRKVCPDDSVWSAYFEREGETLKDRG